MVVFSLFGQHYSQKTPDHLLEDEDEHCIAKMKINDYGLSPLIMQTPFMVSVSCFGVRISVMFHFMFVHCTFSSVRAAEWPPFGK